MNGTNITIAIGVASDVIISSQDANTPLTVT